MDMGGHGRTWADMGGHGRTPMDTVQVTSRVSSADSKECRNWNGIRFDRNTFQSSGQSNNSDLRGSPFLYGYPLRASLNALLQYNSSPPRGLFQHPFQPEVPLGRRQPYRLRRLVGYP